MSERIERDDINKTSNFDATDVQVRDFIVILMLKKILSLAWKNLLDGKLCHPLLDSSCQLAVLAI